ncbi:dipeptide epimerase [Cesiribacter andamanensis]|uniref:Dipeptide epimerase n=1 Tax=Cesiribacter andamanensis AMV16 TaxID=1279009 RepID=M7N9X6_9BACT|nr:dipeptide epimerase [Cesiribacter andamanensis]EMR04011.1 L-Ala-D/L-Glu epimerase [Cesiribacter andamanensis AMV16]
MKLRLHPYELQLSQPFTTSHGSRSSQKTLLVELADGEHSGWGEAAATSYYGIQQDGMMEALGEIRHLIEDSGNLTPDALWERCAPFLKANTFALCALDVAMHDLWARKLGQPLWEHWGLSLHRLPLTNYTIGMDTVAGMRQKMLDQPWPIYKIKLGTPDDIKIVQELRRHTQALFRVDANGGWTVSEALANARALQGLGVEFIEQPLPAGDAEGMKLLFAQSPLPLIADESCQREGDVALCQGHFHGINIKLTKCGGLTPALRMIGRARQLGLQVMVGCMTESTVGISAIAQLLPLVDYADLDGALLLKEDIAEGVSIREGKVYFPSRTGTGVHLLEA